MSKLPYEKVNVVELSKTIAGRLAGLLLADQGANVFILNNNEQKKEKLDTYFNRNKISVNTSELTTEYADIIIVDGDTKVEKTDSQILLRITAALPGDDIYGHLDADCSEDLLNALVGFYTNMSTLGKFINRPVIYTPLPLCSVYAGVIGAISVGSAMVDRLRSGLGREIVSSRIAGGLSAIGALSLIEKGTPDHLKAADLTGLPEGVDPEKAKKALQEASQDADKQLWLEQRLIPLNAPYKTLDGRFAMPVAGVNRRLARRFLKYLGLWEKVLAEGMVDENPYIPENDKYRGVNLADAGSLTFVMNSKLADMISEKMLEKTADDWEKELCLAGVPAVNIRSFDEWFKDKESNAAGLIATVKGEEHKQLGRVAWLKSAQPYPELEICKNINIEDVKKYTEPQQATSFTKNKSEKPLSGFVLVDFANVIAGPNSGRMFSELGATVYKIDPINPQHAPVIMVSWAAEHGVGKKSIIIDMSKDAGKDIMHKIISKADMVLANKRDGQFERMGLGRSDLDKINPKLIAVQLTGHKGEKESLRDNYPGYDPALQGATGLMHRFGEDGCPTFHGVASCVDYLCGYLGTWAGVSALFAREKRGDGVGDWAETSLAAAASLTQLLLQYDKEPETAKGGFATGMNDSERVYQLTDGWVFAQGKNNLTNELKSLNVTDGLLYLEKQGIAATRVQTCKELADKHRDNPTTTVCFEKREKDGWESQMFSPTWFFFDGKSIGCPGATSRIGSDANDILSEIGYSENQITALKENQVVGLTEWVGLKE